MHIADLAMLYSPTGGGIRRYLNAKRSWLSRRTDVRHTLVVPWAPGLPPESEWVGVPSTRLAHGYRLPFGWRAAARALAVRDVDVIEVADPYLLAPAALSARRELGVPVVGFAHGDPADVVRHRYGAAAGRAVSALVGAVYRRFDLVLAPSATIAGRLVDAGITRVRVQPLGVDPLVFHPMRRDPTLRRSLGIASAARLLVYAGRFAPEKNLPALLDAMDRLGPRYVLLAVGAGPVDLAGRDVRVLPFLHEPRALAAVLASADLFVHPGDQETFGLAALEAMACGTPVVGVRGGAISEIVDETVGAIARAPTAEALSAAIHTLMEDDRGRAIRATQARRRASRYSWDCAFDRLLGRYSALLRGTPSVGRGAGTSTGVGGSIGSGSMGGPGSPGTGFDGSRVGSGGLGDAGSRGTCASAEPPAHANEESAAQARAASK